MECDEHLDGQVWGLVVVLMWTYPELHCQSDWTTALKPLQEGRRSLLLQELQRRKKKDF